jgi:hypothetical protein
VLTASTRSLLLLACLYVLLDCAKPLVIDDAAYVYYARQAAAHPLDPYGFAVMWWNRPKMANEVLAPPVLPYWWSLAVRLFGEAPVLWKLWLLPFSLLFVWALHDLFRRFARGLEVPLTWLTVLSPVFLPGLNLMLDVPALALALSAVALFCRAADRNSFALAAVAGLIAGVAAETKYTGFLAPAAMLLYALAYRKLRLWPSAVLVAVQVFVSWEFLMALLYGQSHFLVAVRAAPPGLLQKTYLWVPLLGILGSAAPAVTVLGLAALRAPRRALVLAGALTPVAYALTAVLAVNWKLSWVPFVDAQELPLDLPLELVIFMVLGGALAGVLAVVAWRLCRRRTRTWRPDPASWFLVLWLGLEVLGFFALTPFPAVRRIMGIVVVATLLAGRLAARTARAPDRARLVYGIVCYSAVFGLAFAAFDFWEGWTEKSLAEAAAGLVGAEGGSGTVWYVGHWGFQYYAEKCGMRPVLPYYLPNDGEVDYVPLPEPSHLRAGDYVVEVSWPNARQIVYIDPEHTEPRFWLAVCDPVSLRTVICYYSGPTAVAHRWQDCRRSVTVYRVTEDFDAVWTR